MGDAKGTSFQAFPWEGGKDTKVDALDELIDILKRALEWLLCCVTCGCYPGPDEARHTEVYEVELMDEERQAVSDLLDYLDSVDMKKDPSISEERLRALCILTYSGNVELQKSAALCFAEFSDKVRTPVTPEILEPLLILLRTRDQHVLKAASLAASNFSLNGPDENRSLIVKCGYLPPLIDLLSSGNLEVTCNACGCLTRLASNDEHKQAIFDSGGIPAILSLARSASDVRIQRSACGALLNLSHLHEHKQAIFESGGIPAILNLARSASDVRVKRNACGALLNMTHLQTIRNVLVQEGSLPILVEALHGRDSEVQYYSAAALSNLAVNDRHRAMMVAIGFYDVIKRLLCLLKSKHRKVRYQACLALRNLASDGDNQILIVKLKGLPKLHDLVKVADGEMLTASLACLRNLSIHKANEVGIISETFLCELRRLVVNSSNSENQVHAAGTIRNLAAGDQIESMTRSGCVEALIEVLLNAQTADVVLSEVTAALAVLADEDLNKKTLLTTASGKAFSRLIELAVKSELLDIRYNCAGTIGQLALTEIPPSTLVRCEKALLDYLDVYVHSDDDSFIHISLWTLMQLLSYEQIKKSVQRHKLSSSIDNLLQSGHSSTIKELAETVQKKLQADS